MSQLGDDWEEQQRKWAGGRAPVATGPRQVEDFSEIEEADGGIQGERYGYAGASSTAGPIRHGTERHGNFPTGPAAVQDASRDSRDSNSSRLSVTSSGVQGGRRKPGQLPSMPASIEQVTKLAPAEALRGSTQGQVDDVLSGKRYLNAAMRLEGIAEVPPATADKKARGSSSGVDQVQAPAQRRHGTGEGAVNPNVTIDWDRFPELSSRWSEQYEALEQLLQRLDANPDVGLNQAVLQKRKKAAGPNKVAVTSQGFEAFPNFKDMPGDAVALRDGRLKQILAQDLVPPPSSPASRPPRQSQSKPRAALLPCWPGLVCGAAQGGVEVVMRQRHPGCSGADTRCRGRHLPTGARRRGRDQGGAARASRLPPPRSLARPARGDGHHRLPR